MRRADRPLPKRGRIELANEREQGGAIDRLMLGHRRQDAGQPLRQHTFAGAGWPHHQQTVPSGGSDFECALGLRLAFHIKKIGHGNGFRHRIHLGR